MRTPKMFHSKTRPICCRKLLSVFLLFCCFMLLTSEPINYGHIVKAFENESTNISNKTCFKCNAVYEFLETSQQILLGRAMQFDLQKKIDESCNSSIAVLTPALCKDSPQMLDALMAGSRDSIGKLYSLFASRMMNCPPLSEFLCNCKNETQHC
ncbi:hypothetical protein AB6A40_010287 [Gnathostoma spinigerum]|uniref:Saposin B-type domain-containing protein n=1 Tax=Gnathostoma spinigerum TaxID=75299 RepID=A0ABD6F1G3_9BILA